MFVFFGLVATVGHRLRPARTGITGLAVGAAVPVGLLAVALLVVNNLRDIPGDAAGGKRTLAVRIGAPATRAAVRRLPWWCPSGWPSILAVSRPWALLALLALPLAVPPVRRVLGGRGRQGADRRCSGAHRPARSWSFGAAARRPGIGASGGR